MRNTNRANYILHCRTKFLHDLFKSKCQTKFIKIIGYSQIQYLHEFIQDPASSSKTASLHVHVDLVTAGWHTGDWPEIINISILYIEHGRQPPHAPTKFRPWLQHQEKAHDVVTQPFGRTNVPLVAALPRINANTEFP